jgi:hypothetical protein
LKELLGERVTRQAIQHWIAGRRRVPSWVWAAIARELEKQVAGKLHWLAIASAAAKEKAPD